MCIRIATLLIIPFLLLNIPAYSTTERNIESLEDREERCTTINFVCITSPELRDISNNMATIIIAENQYKIESTITHGNNQSLEFVYVVMVNDENGVTHSLSWVRGILQPNQEMNISTSWLPAAQGHYLLKTRFWQPIEITEPIDPPPGWIWIDTELDVRSAE